MAAFGLYIYIYTLGGLAKFPNGDLELDFKQQKPEIKKLAKWIITSEQNSLKSAVFSHKKWRFSQIYGQWSNLIWVNLITTETCSPEPYGRTIQVSEIL